MFILTYYITIRLIFQTYNFCLSYSQNGKKCRFRFSTAKISSREILAYASTTKFSSLEVMKHIDRGKLVPFTRSGGESHRRPH